MIGLLAYVVAARPLRTLAKVLALLSAGAASHLTRAASGGGVFGYRPRSAGRPFGTPWLALCDSCRFVCFACAGLLLVAIVAKLQVTPIDWWVNVRGRALSTHLSWGRLRLAGELGAAWVVCETEVDHIGYGVGPGGRLWISAAVMLIFGALSVRRVLFPLSPSIG